MKKYLIGAIAGFMLSLGVSAHAEVISMIGKVIDGSFPITIKGIALQNPAITIAGVSYVPTREFAESLGATVKFDANLGIEVVPVTTPTPTPAPSTIPAPQPTPPTMTKEQKTLQIQSRIEIVKMNITSDKMVVWNDEHYPNNLLESEKQKNKDRLAKDETELSDLQTQLDALLAQP